MRASSATRRPPWPPALWALLAAGVALRVIWAATTRGLEYDIANFELLDALLRSDPLEVYSGLGERRYPYPPGYLPVIWLCGRAASLTGVPLDVWIAAPPILADAAIALIVHRFAPGGARARLAAAALVLLGPSFLVTSGYHHQLDSVAILPAVLAVAAFAQRPAVAGALVGLGAALKTVPGFALLALLPHLRGRRERGVLLAAAAAVTGTITLPWLLTDGAAFVRQLDYTGVPGAGGLSLVVHPEAALRWLVVPVGTNGAEQFLVDARWLNVLIVLALGALVWRRRPGPALGAAVIYAGVWVFGMGFFVSYAVWGLPFLLLAGRPGLALALQALLVVPTALFYGGPYVERAAAIPYVACMLAFWALALALVLGGKPDRALVHISGRASAAVARRGLAPFIAPAAAVVLIGFAPLAWLVRRAWRTGDVATAADGIFAGDQWAYLWWIRDAGTHGLAANGFDLAPATQVFTQPMLALSGALWRAGAPLGLSFQLWKPIAAAALLAGFGAYAARTVEGRGRQALALTLALFAGTPLTVLAVRAGLGDERWLDVLGRALPGAHLHGYLPAALSFACMPVFLLALERRRTGWAAGAGLLAAWLHPWQGVVLLLVGAGLLAWSRDRRLLGPLAATALPVLGYLALSRLDPAWQVGRRQNETGAIGPFVLLLAFLPLLLAALPELRRRPRDLQDVALRLWPAAAVVAVYVLPSVPLHALGGVTLPLAILAVRGSVRGAAVALALALPSLAIYADAYRDVALSRTQAHWLRAGEARALDDLEARPGPGGVLAHGAIAAAVPARTGRRVWAGHPSWTPDYAGRTAAAARLFTGAMAPAEARAFVRATGARFLVAGCEPGTVDLRRTLGATLTGVSRHGCAWLYESIPR